MITLGNKLQALRWRHGLSQKDLSKILGVSLDSIQNWEQDRTQPQGFAKVALVAFIASIEGPEWKETNPE